VNSEGKSYPTRKAADQAKAAKAEKKRAKRQKVDSDEPVPMPAKEKVYMHA
jgi:hypothetical protein